MITLLSVIFMQEIHKRSKAELHIFDYILMFIALAQDTSLIMFLLSSYLLSK